MSQACRAHQPLSSCPMAVATLLSPQNGPFWDLTSRSKSSAGSHPRRDVITSPLVVTKPSVPRLDGHCDRWPKVADARPASSRTDVSMSALDSRSSAPDCWNSLHAPGSVSQSWLSSLTRRRLRLNAIKTDDRQKNDPTRKSLSSNSLDNNSLFFSAYMIRTPLMTHSNDQWLDILKLISIFVCVDAFVSR